MFPNVRVVIAAIIASVLGIGCGLGVFAAFNISHDPFARLPGVPPMQLVSGHVAPGAGNDTVAAPFGARFAVNASPGGSVAPTGMPIFSLPATGSSVSPPATETSVENPVIEPMSSPAPQGQATVEMLPQAQTTAEPVSSTEPPVKGAEAVAVGTSMGQSERSGPPAAVTKIAPEGAKLAPKKPAVRSMHRVARREVSVAKVHRVRRIQPTLVDAAGQNYSFMQPVYQPALQPTVPGPQGVRRRVIVKRRRAIKKAAEEEPITQQAAVAQSASGSPEQ